MTSDAALPAVAVPGFRPDSLGNYLASLGLLRLLARKWPSARAGWHDGIFHLVGGPATIEDLLSELSDIAVKRAWTPYERSWGDAQRKSTRAKSGAALALWQGSADERALELLTAHLVPAARVSFNPLLGSGGNAGKRDFSAGWKQAVDALAAPCPAPAKKVKRTTNKDVKARDTLSGEEARKRAELRALLFGEPTTWMLEKLNAASWFSDANKLYNSGQGPFREGLLSPWAMALACEGLVFLAGGASRRLGARSRAVGAFPFVTRAAGPCVAGEAGRDLAEVWAPLWERPMTLPEARALFLRGRAEIQGRGVLTPSAFATAIVRRGVDAGISEFRRFVLGRTTSANTFEPRFEGSFRLRAPSDAQTALATSSATALSVALERVLRLIDRLPADRKVGQRWRFVGLRGPIETAMLQLAAAPDDPATPRAMLDSVVESLDRVDRNRSLREQRVSWEPLPIQWLPALFGDQQPTVEARLAMALVSGFPALRPFLLYRFGVEVKHRRFEHLERPPARWVWGPGPLTRVLSAVLHRRTLDWESAGDDEEPARPMMPATGAHVGQWLDGTVDEKLLERWMSRFALFDWRFVPSDVRRLVQSSSDRPAASAALCLFGLFEPLFALRSVQLSRPSPSTHLFDPKAGAQTPGAARTLASLVRAGRLDAAVRFAGSRYAMAGAPLARTNAPWHVGDSERLLASVLFSVADHERIALIERWLRPRRQQGDEAHARQ